MIYFIHGPDRLLARTSAHAIAIAADPECANTSWLDGRDTSLDSVIVAIGTLSFFGGARVVVVTGLLDRSERDGETGNASAGEDSKAVKNSATLIALARAVPEHHTLILLEPGMSAAPSALKSAAPDAKVIAGDPPRAAALLAWISETATSAGSRIDLRTAQLLAESLYPQTWDRKPSNPRYDRPPDMALLQQEIGKLALAAHPAEIRDEHIEALVPGGPDQRVFRFLDAAVSGDLRTATAELDRLEAAGEEPAMILAQVLGQIELNAVATAAGDRDASTVARDIGSIAASRMSAVIASSRRQPLRMVTAVEIGALIDRSLKAGLTRRPYDALHELILALATSSPAQRTGRSQ